MNVRIIEFNQILTLVRLANLLADPLTDLLKSVFEPSELPQQNLNVTQS